VQDTAFGHLLQLCLAWHSDASAQVPLYAAMTASDQAAFRIAHGGRDAAANVALGLSLYGACLNDLARQCLAVDPAARHGLSGQSPLCATA
jgi:hypothetical protein